MGGVGGGRAAQYLRTRHRYCHYCSTRFASAAALEARCRQDEACDALFALDCSWAPGSAAVAAAAADRVFGLD